jgi:hypothetical protein
MLWLLIYKNNSWVVSNNFQVCCDSATSRVKKHRQVT